MADHETPQPTDVDGLGSPDPSPRSRVAMVTGGARGIGAAVCDRLAAQGRSVAVVDRLAADAEGVATRIGATASGARAYGCDVTDSDQVRSTVASIEADLGPVEILVNVAGYDRFLPFVDTDEDFWDLIIDINFKGVLRTTHAVLPGMNERGWGRIINVASDAARVGSSLESVYAGAKAGVIAFTKTVARESARRGVTANVVAPGPTDTQLLADLAAETELGQKIVGGLQRAIPLGRLAQPDDIAYGVACFASDDAGYITGQTLSISGGLTMM